MGMEISSTGAYSWYLKAVEQDDTLVQNNFGCLYRDGRGVQKNIDEAARWFIIAAGLGCDLTLYNLAICT